MTSFYFDMTPVIVNNSNFESDFNNNYYLIKKRISINKKLKAMKKITTLVLLAVFSFVVVLNLNAQESFQSSQNKNQALKNEANHRILLKVNSDNKIVLRADLFEGQKRLHYTLKVFSETGDMVYKWNFLKKGSIYKSYDISNLPEGKYTFSVLKKNVPLYSKTIINGTSNNTTPCDGELVVEKL